MKLNIRGEKTEITKAMKEYAEEKLNKLKKYIDKEELVEGHILFKVNGPKQKVEITIPLKNYTLRVEETGEDFYSIIDTSLNKLERQIRKNKTRLSSKKNKEKKDFILDFVEVEEQEEIVKRKKINLKPMDEEEAIIQMELSNHDFFFFKNSSTNKTAIVYKRKDKDYGLIEEE